MRISDWSSDVCSSDLYPSAIAHRFLPIAVVISSPVEEGCFCRFNLRRAAEVPAVVPLRQTSRDARCRDREYLVAKRDRLSDLPALLHGQQRGWHWRSARHHRASRLSEWLGVDADRKSAG